MNGLRKTIGNTTLVTFPEFDMAKIPARVDTGARLSSIWASAEERPDGTLAVTFFGENSPLYRGEPIIFTTYDRIIISSSMGQTQERYKVRLLIGLRGKRVRSWPPTVENDEE